MDKPERLIRSQHSQLGVFLPQPISGRLDALCATVADRGERCSRRELVAAVLLAARLSPPDGSRIHDYREASVRDACVAGQPSEYILTPITTRGPRQLLLPFEGNHKKVDDSLLDERLSELPTQRYGFMIPTAVRDRLDALEVELTERLPKPIDTHRDEIVAALLLAAPEEPRTLAHRLHRYRLAELGDAARKISDRTERRRRMRGRVTGRRYYPSL